MSDWNIRTTNFGELTQNPLRILWERDQPPGNSDKSFITLQAGDPTIYGNFPPHPKWVEAIAEAVQSDKFSYDESAGIREARQAVAEYSQQANHKITFSDVILTSGCSMAIEICMSSLANAGENILIPRPAWNYITWTAGLGIETKSYNLDPTNGWNVDLKHMDSVIDDKTRAILINNPGNPCGNVYSKEHILEIIAIAERHKLPIIADEVYEYFVFPGNEFHSFASLSENVPILKCSGLTKRFLMPGVRMGWLVINDRGGKLTAHRKTLNNIAGRNFGPNSSVQWALPKILKCLPQHFFDEINERVGKNATVVHKFLSKLPGINPIMPKGAMYMMIGVELSKFPELSSSFAFMRALATDQSVFVYPGEGFNFDGFFRIVITAPEELLIEVCNRMKEFCEKHFVD